MSEAQQYPAGENPALSIARWIVGLGFKAAAVFAANDGLPGVAGEYAAASRELMRGPVAYPAPRQAEPPLDEQMGPHDEAVAEMRAWLAKVNPQDFNS